MYQDNVNVFFKTLRVIPNRFQNLSNIPRGI